LLRLTGRYLLSLLVIALILAGGHFLLEQGRILRQSSAERDALQAADQVAGGTRAQLVAEARARGEQAARMSLAQIDQRIAQQAQVVEQGSLAPVAASDPVTARLLAQVLEPLQREVARQERDYLLRLRTWLVAVSSREQQGRVLEQRRREHLNAYAEYVRLLRQKKTLGAVPQAWMETRLPLDDDWSRLQRDIDRAATASNAAHDAYVAQQAAIRALGQLGNAPVLNIDHNALDAATAPLTARLARARAGVSANWLARVGTPVLRQLPLAFAILLSGWLIHLLVKMLFYYVLAPLAGRCKPICLMPKTATQLPQATASKVSHSVLLEPGQELLVLPDYLQSASSSAIKTTRWLFDWHTPWTSLIAGMVMLTRVRTSTRLDPIVVSSNSDPLSEVALIAIPKGAALVFQPRALVGVIQYSARPLRMRRRWQLFSVHAWLTMQLRYLVFTGPVTLIVKGTRGVRAESAGAGGQARLISQSATLGFSAQLAYSTVRSATFIAYYTDRAALLDDRFEGEGVYIYAETARRAPGGAGGRALDGVVDAVLKVFGI
jgi:hypothetical protein